MWEWSTLLIKEESVKLQKLCESHSGYQSVVNSATLRQLAGMVHYVAGGSGCEVLWWVCLSVCLSARICPEPHARSLPMHSCACCVRGSVLLRHVDDRPHRLSAGRWAEGDGSAQRRRSVTYDCRVPLVDKRVDGRYKTLWSLVSTCHTWAP